MVNRTLSTRPFHLAILLALFFFSATPQPSVSQAATVSTSPIEPVPQLLSSSDTGVRFSLTPGLPTITPDTIVGADYQQLSLVGFMSQPIAGQPALPQLGVSVALPPGAVPVVRLLHSEPATLPVGRLAPAATRTLANYDTRDLATVPQFADSYVEDTSVYASDSLFPADAVMIGREGTLRDQRFATIWVRPVQYNPVQGQILAHTHLEVAVDFLYPAGRPSLSPAAPESATFTRIMADTFINYDAASQWRQRSVTVPNTAQTSPCMDENSFRITVTQTGMHQLTYAELVAAGFPNNGSVPDSKIRMCHLANEIDIMIDNQNSSATFGSGDAIVFYGEQLKTQETARNVYWLTYSSSGPDGQRMGAAAAAPGGATPSSRYQYTERLEDDVEYLSTFPMNDENDHWYWELHLSW